MQREVDPLNARINSQPWSHSLLRNPLNIASSETETGFHSIGMAIANLRSDSNGIEGLDTIIEGGPGVVYLIDSNSLDLRYLADCNGDSSDLHSALTSSGCWIDAIQTKDRYRYQSTIESIIHSNESKTVEYGILNDRGEAAFHVKDFLSPVVDRQGNVVGILGRLLDESFRLQTMDTLAKRSWKEVSSIASRRFLHDFNNMIAGIYSLSELYAIPGSDAETMTEAMTHIRDSASRAQKITQKIRALITMSSGEESYFDVRKLIEEQKDYLLAMLPKTADLKLHLGDEPLPVHLDANRFRQTLIHLAANASDAANEKPTIHIRCYQDLQARTNDGCEMVALEFSDDGIGIDTRELPKVVEPFYTTKDQEAHSGMGLFVVDQFVRSLGGRLSIASARGEGTQVVFTLPLVKEALEATSSPLEKGSRSNPTKSNSSGRNLNVLIYTWEDIAHHPLINSIRSAGWKHRIHLDCEQLQLDIREMGAALDGIVIFKSALDEKVEDLVVEIAELENAPKRAVVALGESVDAVSERIRSNCGILVSGSAKPAGLLKTLEKFFS